MTFFVIPLLARQASRGQISFAMGNTALDITASRGILDAAPGIRTAFARYASTRRDGAPYAVVGTVRIPGKGVVCGILGFSENEFFAHVVCRALSRYAVAHYGGVRVRRTEWCPDGGEFDVRGWRHLMRRVPPAARVHWDRIVVTPETAPSEHAQLEALCFNSGSE